MVTVDLKTLVRLQAGFMWHISCDWSPAGKCSETLDGINILWTYLEYISVTVKEYKNEAGMYDTFPELSSKFELFVTQEFYEFKCFIRGNLPSSLH